MTLPFRIDPDDVAKMQGPREHDFVRLLNALIPQHAIRGGIAQAEIATNHDTNKPDGRVDAAIHAPWGDVDATGYMSNRTCWQFKARSWTNIKDAGIRSEFREPKKSDGTEDGFALRKLIREGYTYVICIADGLSDDRRRHIADLAHGFAKDINAAAPKPIVLGASEIALWVTNGYPGIAKMMFPERHLDDLKPLDLALQPLRGVTGIYRAAESRADALVHVADFVQATEDPKTILRVSGPAGVGKSRFVLETLDAMRLAGGTVIYTGEASAGRQVAELIAAHPDPHIILVCDECTTDARVNIEQSLTPKAHARAVCIETEAEPDVCDIWLRPLDGDDVEAIVDENFPYAGPERRAKSVEVSEGYIRFAADICRSQAELADVHDARDYLKVRLSDDDLLAVMGISMVSRIGYRAPQDKELEGLSDVLGLVAQDVVVRANAMKNSPGFITFAGPFLYVTPSVAATAGFRLGWSKWFEADPSRILLLPGDVLQAFQQQAALHASDDGRAAIAATFRDWAGNVSLHDFADYGVARLAVTLLEIDPSTFLPWIRRLLNDADSDSLSKAFGEPEQYHPFGGNERGRGRRRLVHALRTLAAFSDHFYDAECCLWLLAQYETDLELGNNSQREWAQLFQIALSGTEVAFDDRLELLMRRLNDASPAQYPILLMAVDQVLDTQPILSGLVKSFGGREVPSSWKPASYPDWQRLIGVALDRFLTECGDPTFAEVVLPEIISSTSILFERGLAKQWLQAVTEHSRPEDLPEIFDALQRHQSYANRTMPPGVQEWRNKLVHGGEHESIVSVVSTSPFRIRGEEEEFAAQISEVAARLTGEPELFLAELPWLLTKQAKSAFLLGRSIASLDRKREFWPHIQASIDGAESIDLIRGYINQWYCDDSQLAQLPWFKDWAFDLVDQNQQVGFELIAALEAPEIVTSLMLELVETGALGREYFAALRYGGWISDIPDDQRLRIFELLVDTTPSTDTVTAALELISMLIFARKEDMDLSSETEVALYWTLAEQAISVTNHEAFEWKNLVLVLGNLDLSRAILMAVQALSSRQNFSISEEAEELLQKWSGERPNEVMDSLGRAMLQEETTWTFHIREMRDLFRSLPVATVISWLEEHGVDGARNIARHLSPPHRDENGAVVLPELTRYVIETFGHDEETMSNLSAGIHTGSMTGDISGVIRERAKVADELANDRHPLVRTWAASESKRSVAEAAHWDELRAAREFEL